jgi:NitT/TauT family transport system ATP-binding protein
MSEQPLIRVARVSHEFSSTGKVRTLAVDDVSIDVANGEFVAIVGPSGCGKTTVLNMIAGLVRPMAGSVSIGGDDVTGIRDEVGYMFARDGLLPWRSAIDNVGFGLELRGMGEHERRARSQKLLELVGLSGFERHLRSELSHGMRQRVALARTLATEPRILLMDEPFGALDAQTRLVVQDAFIRIWESDRKTVVFVTHDIVEAIVMSDRVVVFTGRPGRIKAQFCIDLPRPRSAVDLVYSPAFEQLRADVWNSLRSEVAST